MFKKIIGKLSNLGGNTIYYPGCLTKFAGTQIEENYKKILTNLGIEFITLPEFKCCGSPVLAGGYKKDFDNLIRDNKAIFKKYSVNKIITNCPSCFKMFKKYYELDNIEVEHITQTLAANLTKLPARKFHGKSICYHDPCHLGRGSGVYEAPRKVLRMLGFKVVELKDNKAKSMCCGGGGGLKSNYDELSNKIAKIRLKQCPEKMIITPCTLCYKHLKENNKGTGIKVLEFSEVLI